MRDDPTRVYYTEGNRNQFYESIGHDNRPRPIDSRHKDTTFVKYTEAASKRDHARHSTHPGDSLNFPSELILPSIEDGFSVPQDQHAPFPDSSQRANIPDQREDERLVLQQSHPFLNNVGRNEEYLHLKRRKVNDRLPSNHQRPNTILIPLDSGESYSSLHSMPSPAQYVENMPFPNLDERIVQLPPRGSEIYDDGGKRSKTLAQSEHFENRSVHGLPHKQMQVMGERSGQPPSLRRSVASHNAHNLMSPNFPVVSGPLYCASSLASRPLPQTAFGTTESNGVISSNQGVSSHPPRPSEEVQGKLQKDFAIDPNFSWNHESSTKRDTGGKYGIYAPSQAASLSRLPGRFERGVRIEGRDKRHQDPSRDNPSTLRIEQRQHDNQVETGSHGYGEVAYESPRVQWIGRDGAEPLEQSSSYSLARGADWSGLQLSSTRMFHKAYF